MDKNKTYKNWMPTQVMKGFKLAPVILIGLTAFNMYKGNKKATRIMLPLSVISSLFFIDSLVMEKKYNLDEEDSLANQILDNIANKVDVKDGDSILDVGAGSGALGFRIAKKDKKVLLTGVDCFEGYKNFFSENLWKKNALAEDIKNAKFIYGDARELPFKDGEFDIIVSNYVYHNIPSSKKKRTKILLESLRCLEKGGKFYFHDVFNQPFKYQSIDKIKKELKEAGISKIDFEPTDRGNPIPNIESKFIGLKGSGILYGTK